MIEEHEWTCKYSIKHMQTKILLTIFVIVQTMTKIVPKHLTDAIGKTKCFKELRQGKSIINCAPIQLQF